MKKSLTFPFSKTIATLVSVFHGVVGAFLLVVVVMVLFVFPGSTRGDVMAMTVLITLVVAHGVVAVGVWRGWLWGLGLTILLDAVVTASIGLSVRSAMLSKTSALDQTLIHVLLVVAVCYVLVLGMAVVGLVSRSRQDQGSRG